MSGLRTEGEPVYVSFLASGVAVRTSAQKCGCGFRIGEQMARDLKSLKECDFKKESLKKKKERKPK